MLTKVEKILLLCLISLHICANICAGENNEFKIKRENDFTFQAKPKIEKFGEGFNISFEVKSYCDVTIVIEEENTGKILRHLISGVLGANAPAPLLKDSKIQKVYFDGKNDYGQYLKDFAYAKVRVSLGLSPVFEKTLFDFPKRRHSIDRQLLCPIEDGVIVYDGGDNIDFVKLYSHSGDYIKTLYPFPADKIKEVKGLKWKNLPDGSGNFPVKTNFLQTSFLETGSNFAMKGKLPTNYGWKHFGMYGKAATFLAANKNKVAFGMGYMARLGLDGSSGGMDFMGPAIGYHFIDKKGEMLVQPASAAISTDGKKIYFTGYHYCNYGAASADIVTSGDWVTHHHIYEMELSSNEPPKLFLGNPVKAGADDYSFNMPVNITIDESNRIYVCDYLNNRVQVFDENKKLLKSIKINYPAFVSILPNSKEVIVITHLIHNKIFNAMKPPPVEPINYYNLGKFENLAVGKSIQLPKEYVQGAGRFLYSGSGFGLGLCVTDYSGEIKLWVSQEKVVENAITRKLVIPSTNIKIWKLSGDHFVQLKDFEEDVKKEIVNTKPIHYSRVRLQVNPATGDLFTTKTIHGADGDKESIGKSFKELYKINPNTEKISIIDLAFDAEDFCFDNAGLLYLKTQNIVGRFNFDTMKEVPWDYGIETDAYTSTSSDRKIAKLVSGLKTPTFAFWHHGGVFVGLNGNIAISGPNMENLDSTTPNLFKPEFFPGRLGMSKINNLIHIYDKYGILVKNDVVPGLKDNYGIGLDQNNNIYLMNSATRVINGKPYPNDWTGTIMKFPFSGSKLFTDSDTPIPLPVANKPNRSYDVGNLWVDNAAWYFGGVGFMGKNSSKDLAEGTGCACWNSRMAFDYLNRTFAPELERYSVAILDSNGNLITRVGRYGNRDSKGANSLKPVGGDEITMIHGAYLATMTDKFLYIADIANDRIIAIKLNYASNEINSLPLK